MTEIPPLAFWVSGTLRLRVDDHITVLRPTRLHEILALLLLRANTPVTISDIVSSVWPDKRPVDDEFIRSYISRLRNLLRDTGVRVVSMGHRYSINLDPMCVDVLRFERLMATADRTTDPAEQRRRVDEALAACPTDALLTDFTRSWAHVARTRHQQAWDDAALRRNRYWLRDGLHDQLLSVLQRADVRRSTNQRWVEDYLLTLHRTGRIREALVHYRALEQHLQTIKIPVNERLRSLAAAIEREDPALDQPGAWAAVTVPDILPPPRGPLFGRHAAIRAVRLHANTGVHDAVRVVGIYGPPGIGKTAFAIAYAHAHKGRYPGGVLYADFGAYGAGTGSDLDTVLVSFLGALGISGHYLPPERETRLSRYRDLVRRRPVLVVLDNVAASRDVEALLPTAPGSLAIVTSRARLTALTSRFRALPIVLDRIDEPSSVMLVTALIGERAAHDAPAVADIVRACGGHPLALCLAGARIATRAEEALTALATAMAHPAGRIGALDRYAEPGDAVADVFGWSYRSLDPDHARAFRMMGLSPCTTLDLPAIAQLIDVDIPLARAILSDLAAAHLVTSHDGERYGMLDLMANYAAVLAADTDSPSTIRTAIDRLYAHQRMMTEAAALRLWPDDRPGRPIQPFDDPATARHWLDDHRADLLAGARHPHANARPGHVVELSANLFRYLDHGGHLDDATHLYTAAVAAARRLSRPVDTARSLNYLGAVLIRRGWMDAAEAALIEARTTYEQLGDRRGQASTLGNLGRLVARRGEYQAATDYQIRALRLFRAAGDRLGEARTLTNLGIVHEASDDLVGALYHHNAARIICEAEHAPDALARALGSLAGVHRRQGMLDAAWERYNSALVEFQALGDRIGEATTLTNMGLVRSEQGSPVEAVKLHDQALEIFEMIDDQANVVETLNNLGTALFAAGKSAMAVAQHHRALITAERLGDRSETTRAHISLAALYAQAVAHGEGTAPTALAAARSHLVQARDGYAEMGKVPPEQLDRLADHVAEWS